MNQFSEDMAAFSEKDHRRAITYFKTLMKHGWTIRDAESWLARKQFERDAADKLLIFSLAEQQAAWSKIALKCPNCASPMNLFPVNTGPADQTGDDSKSVWRCLKPACFYDQYNKFSLSDYVRKSEKIE